MTFESKERPQVLAYRLGSLGDMCVAIPAFRLLKQRYPGAEMTLLTNISVGSNAPAAASVLEGLGLFDHYLAYPVGIRNPISLSRLLWRLRARKFSLVANLTSWRGLWAVRRDEWFFRTAGIRRRVGFVGAQAVPAGESPVGLVEHEAVRLLRQIGGCCEVDLGDPKWFEIKPSARNISWAREVLGRSGIVGNYIAASVGTKVSVKDWTQENWVNLVRRIGNVAPGTGLVFVGSLEDFSRSQRCLETWPGPTLNACGKASLEQSGALLAGARLFVGHDSGPMHLAAAVGTSCVAIFSGRSLPGQWFPLGTNHKVIYHRMNCSGCGLESCVEYKKKCILSITPEEVFEALRPFFEKSML